MKKIIGIVLSFVILFSFVSCGSGKPDNTSDAMYQIGLNALSVADNYISGQISGEEADKRIEEFEKQAEVQCEQEQEEAGEDTLVGTEYYNDSSIEHDIFMLSLSVGRASRGDGAMSDLIEKRNELAEQLGEPDYEQ